MSCRPYLIRASFLLFCPQLLSKRYKEPASTITYARNSLYCRNFKKSWGSSLLPVRQAEACRYDRFEVELCADRLWPLASVFSIVRSLMAGEACVVSE